jgi:hypothetical protein
MIIAFTFLSTSVAQEVIEKSVNLGKDKNAEMNFDFANHIVVKTWENKEARVKATVNINDNADNDKFQLTIDQDEQGVTMKAKIKDPESLMENSYQVTNGAISKSDGLCIKMEIDYEILLPKGTIIQLESISGNIEISGFEAPMNIETISGFIDLVVNPRVNVSFETGTITGEIYSDLDLDLGKTPSNMRIFRSGDIKATLNGGGKLIKLETISGDIYLRKEK